MIYDSMIDRADCVCFFFNISFIVLNYIMFCPSLFSNGEVGDLNEVGSGAPELRMKVF